MWIVLAAALVTVAADLSAAPRAKVDQTDRRTERVPFPDGKAIAIEVTIGAVRIDGWDKPEAEIVIERRAPAAVQLAALTLQVEDSTSRLVIRVLQADDGTDPAIRADITMRLPRAALVERLQVREGRISITAMTGSVTADIGRGPIEGRELSGMLRLETGIGSIALTGTRLSPNGLLRLRAFNGDVRLTLAERPTDARILALAVNGQVKSNIPLTRRETWGPRWGETTLGKGEPVISIDVVTGTVEIKSP